MWAKNEADIIAEIIDDAILRVDTLMIADDGSTDGTWEIIEAKRLQYPDRIEHTRRSPDPDDKGQRQALLDEVRRRYREDDTWVQVIEADVFLLDTDVRAVVAAEESNLAVSWQTLNAVRHLGTWQAVDTYPRWTCSVRELMPVAHWMEVMLYTFRPMQKVFFDRKVWRPWPKGWSYYTSAPLKKDLRTPTSPLVLHVGYRGPTHFHVKYQRFGERHPKYTTWDLTSPRSVEETVSFFNGDWNRHLFPATREGWTQWLRARHASRESTLSPT